MATTKYCAIIGDIRRSRQLPRRGAVQKRFAGAIASLNREFRKEIASSFLITLGDEFQGLLLSPAASFRLIRRFQELMDPVPFSFGVGVGTLSTPLEKQAVGMDGEAFHPTPMHADRAFVEQGNRGVRSERQQRPGQDPVEQKENRLQDEESHAAIEVEHERRAGDEQKLKRGADHAHPERADLAKLHVEPQSAR